MTREFLSSRKNNISWLNSWDSHVVNPSRGLEDDMTRRTADEPKCVCLSPRRNQKAHSTTQVGYLC